MPIAQGTITSNPSPSTYMSVWAFLEMISFEITSWSWYLSDLPIL